MQGIRYHSKGVFIDRRYDDEIYGRHACEHGSLVFRFLKEGAPRRRKRGGFCLDTSGVPAGRRGYRRPASFRRAALTCSGLAPHVFPCPPELSPQAVALQEGPVGPLPGPGLTERCRKSFVGCRPCGRPSSHLACVSVLCFLALVVLFWFLLNFCHHLLCDRHSSRSRFPPSRTLFLAAFLELRSSLSRLSPPFHLPSGRGAHNAEGSAFLGAHEMF